MKSIATGILLAASGLTAGSHAQSLSFYSHGDPSAYEQLMLEWINKARRDPSAEVARLGISLNTGLADGRISPAPRSV